MPGFITFCYKLLATKSNEISFQKAKEKMLCCPQRPTLVKKVLKKI